MDKQSEYKILQSKQLPDINISGRQGLTGVNIRIGQCLTTQIEMANYSGQLDCSPNRLVRDVLKKASANIDMLIKQSAR